MVNDHVAIILAAGEGKRMRPYTNNTSKCLLKVGNKRLIEHIVDACEEAGIKDIVVVVGYQKKRVKRLLGNRVKYVVNKKYHSTQTMYSLWLTRKIADGRPLIQINGDTYFHPLILKKLIGHAYPDAMAVDLNAKLDEEATKVIVQGGRVRMIGKELPIRAADGECLGIRKYSARTASKLYKEIGKSIRRGGAQKYIFEVLNNFLRVNRFDAVQTDGLPWTEIDFEKDLVKARKINSMPIVLIFAAGVGRRILPLTSDMPKALLRIGGKTLIERQIELFKRAGLNDIVVIVGHKKNAVKRLLGNSVRHVENPLYKTTQTMYSLWQTRKFVFGRPLIIVMGDLLFDEKLLSKLLKSKKPDCAIVDCNVLITPETVKVKIKNNKVLYIDIRNIAINEAIGEYIGLNKLSVNGSKLLFKICEKIIEKSPHWKLAHIPFNVFVKYRPFYAIYAEGEVWAEIDFEKDYSNAKKMRGKWELKQ